MKNPALFIVGCPRSGTTLLQRIIDAHFQITITPETHWIPKYYRSLAPGGAITNEVVTNILEYKRFPNLGITEDQAWRLLRSGPLSYSQFVSGIFDLYGVAKKKPFVGDKTPGYSRELRLLHELWPQAKFIHLIRDGRDVCLSVSSWRKAEKIAERFSTWRENAVLTTAVWWMWHVYLGRQDGASMPAGIYYELKYEDLVTAPEIQVRKICEFLEIPFEDSMVRFYEGRYKGGANARDAKHAWLPITAGLRDWRTQMPEGTQRLFESQASELLAELGYEVRWNKEHTQASESARDFRNRFAHEVLNNTHFAIPAGW